MEFPVIVNNNGRLMLYDKSLVDEIGVLRESELEVAVDHEGKCNMRWILDARADFYELTVIGMMPATLMQRIGVKRRRIAFRLSSPRMICASELKERISGLIDPNPDFQNVESMKKSLAEMSPEDLWTAEKMKNYLGGSP